MVGRLSWIGWQRLAVVLIGRQWSGGCDGRRCQVLPVSAVADRDGLKVSAVVGVAMVAAV